MLKPLWKYARVLERPTGTRREQNATDLLEVGSAQASIGRRVHPRASCCSLLWLRMPPLRPRSSSPHRTCFNDLWRMQVSHACAYNYACMHACMQTRRPSACLFAFVWAQQQACLRPPIGRLLHADGVRAIVFLGEARRQVNGRSALRRARAPRILQAFFPCRHASCTASGRCGVPMRLRLVRMASWCFLGVRVCVGQGWLSAPGRPGQLEVQSPYTWRKGSATPPRHWRISRGAVWRHTLRVPRVAGRAVHGSRRGVQLLRVAVGRRCGPRRRPWRRHALL